jgi:aryl-alcohol dehydrogenase-like predicted oxidoreductase
LISDESIVTKWDVLAIKVLLTDNKSVSKAGYSEVDGIRAPDGRPAACTISDSFSIRWRLQVEYRRLGGSGVKVSEISLGSWLTYGGSVAEEQATACISRAFELGINFFDTANVYMRGAAEEIVGRALRNVERDSYFLATKVYFPMGEGPNDRGLSRKHITEQCHASLKRLGVDYVDLYQCHRYDEDTSLEETLRALDDLIRQGKVLYIGVSEWTADQISDALRIAEEMNLDRIVSNQPRYNMIQRKIEGEVIPLCEREGVGQVVFSPLAQGVLTGKYHPGEAPEAGTRAADPENNRFMQQLMNEEVLSAVDGLRSVASEAGLSMPQLALAWVLRQEDVSSAIIGASRPEQVDDNAATSGVELSADMISEIDRILDGVTRFD